MVELSNERWCYSVFTSCYNNTASSFTVIGFSLMPNGPIRVKREDGPGQTLSLCWAVLWSFQAPASKVRTFQCRDFFWRDHSILIYQRQAEEWRSLILLLLLFCIRESLSGSSRNATWRHLSCSCMCHDTFMLQGLRRIAQRHSTWIIVWSGDKMGTQKKTLMLNHLVKLHKVILDQEWQMVDF